MVCPYDFRADKGAGVEHYLTPQKILIRKTEELAKASSSALVYCVAEMSVLRMQKRALFALLAVYYVCKFGLKIALLS